MTELYNFRGDYKRDSLIENDVDENPIVQFKEWMNQAISYPILEPNAMTLATSTLDGKPSARVVLLKSFDEQGFVFYTNYESKKGRELAQNPYASIVFDWHVMERQIRIDGIVEKISTEESDAYFNSRPADSNLGAWVSPQSSFVEGRAELEDRKAKTELIFKDKQITRPPYWGGYVLIPHTIEFWQGRPSRLHDRLIYIRTDEKWILRRLAP
ncbi:MAG: pyridoxamine 5'-phosphate oxidase [Dysgonamonadaceae bacterium]|nr:pyridoxamine 5'-phosphate oxidase [Dysgonamonadaceae bacterium]